MPTSVQCRRSTDSPGEVGHTTEVVAPPETPGASLRVDAGKFDSLIRAMGNIRIRHRMANQQLQDVRTTQDVLNYANGQIDRLAIENRKSNGSADRCARLEEVRLSIQSANEGIRMLKATMNDRLMEVDLLLEQTDEAMRSVRLLPLSSLSMFLERAARDVADEQGKQIQFELLGGELTLDRAIIQSVTEPLLHLVRNAVAHGIETPKLREQAGKPPRGLVQIEAARVGNRVRVLVSDDGNGVDLAKIKKAASAHGLLKEKQGAQTNAELREFIFHAGLTTTSVTDMVSGRGLGLDIVHTRLRELQTSCSLIEGKLGGATFEFHLPLHLEIVRVITVRVGSGIFGIPTDTISAACRFDDAQIQSISGMTTISSEWGPIPLSPLDHALGVGGAEKPSGGGCVTLEVEGRRLAFHVEEIMDEAEILVEQLGFPLEQLRHIVGCALLPDGSIIQLLNPGALLRHPLVDAPHGLEESKRNGPKPRILVVDDSPTSGLFASSGFDVRVAGDGVEGTQIFNAEGADAIISDIQMPRMDGFEFTRTVKRTSGGKVPVILVTGRESESDRIAGAEAGADAFVVKSDFDEYELLETVRRLL